MPTGSTGLGYGDRKEFEGGEIEAGYRTTYRGIGVNLAPISGIWYKKKDARYREETFSNGITVCRDTSNGQFSEKDNCAPGFDYAAVVSGDFSPAEMLRVGTGPRVGRDVTPFASAALVFTHSAALQLKVGSNYFLASFTLGF